MMAFHVGQKVVCIKKDAWRRPFSGNGLLPQEASPKYGDVLQIRAVDQGLRGIYLRFEEIRNPILIYSGGESEVKFNAKNFRPVVERKTSIEIFTAMLTPSDTPRVPANVEAV